MIIELKQDGEFTDRVENILYAFAGLFDDLVEFVEDQDADLRISEERFDGLSIEDSALLLFTELCASRGPVLNPFPGTNPDKILYLDIETHNEGKQWDMSPREFFRLGQYAWGIEGEVHLTESYDEVMEQLAQAEGIVAHNGHNFDLSVLYGRDSVTPLLLTKDRKVIDTMVWANLAFPAPHRYTTRSGATFHPRKPGEFLRWLSLDNLAFQFGIDGKYGSLKELAKKYNPKGTKVADLDFGLIDLKDEDFLAYAKQDIIALQGITKRLLMIHPMTEYDWREQLCAAINAQISRNGFRVDVEAAQERVNALATRRQDIMDALVRDYDFPTEGKSPWASNAGKEAIVRILASFGITPETHDWPRTPTGALKLGGNELIDLTKGTEAEEIGLALAEIKGQRSLSQLTLDCTKGDHRVHPSIDDLQRSGRSSVTNPGLTVWTSRGTNSVEKSYYVAEPGCKLVSFDFSNADARAVAAYSKDPEYQANFLPGVDNHMNVARQVYGDREDFEENAKDYRQLAKACVAEGTLVLTDQGEVPIEEITLDHLLWDGESFVKHEGMVYSGEKEVIHYDGITATPDHKVYTTEGLEVPFGVAASRGYTLEVTGDGGRPVSTCHDHFRPSTEKEEIGQPLNNVCASGVCDVRSERVAGLGQPIQWENERVSPMHVAGKRSELPSLAGEKTLSYEATVSEPRQPELPVVWGARDNVRLGLDSRSGAVDNGERDPARPGTTVRPDRQRPRVWSGEHSHGNSHAEYGEQEEHGHRSLGSGRVALFSECCSEETESWVHEGRDHSRRSCSCCGAGVSLEARQGKVRVYDILNVGPNHRFTANGKLVANCSHAWNYGGGAKTISRAAGVDADTAQHFVNKMSDAFKGVVAWRQRMADLGERQGYIVNKWGRRMPVEVDQAYTQSAALMGQSGTREVMNDAKIKMLEYDLRLIQWIVVPIHDELIFSIPESELAWAVPKIEELMYYNWDGVEFHASHGDPADNWYEAGH